MSANHTVTQSAFAEPCKALPGGMDSGFMSNPNNTVVPAPQMAMQVTVATPICKSTNLYSQTPTDDFQGFTANKRPVTTVVRE